MIKNIIGVLKNPFKPVKFGQVIFFITGKCNLRCHHCFYWKSLNTKEQLSFNKIAKISNNLPKFSNLQISGGEPFLRKDIVEIIKTFKKNNKILGVNIPTNGTLTTETIKKLKLLLKIDPLFSVDVNFSIDGIQKIHEEIRGVKGTFNQAITTLKKVSQLKKTYPNLKVSINTVISAKNIKHLKKFIKFISLQKNILLDGHYFEIVRGNPLEKKVKIIKPEKLKYLYEKVLLPYQEKLWRQRKGNKYINIIFSSFARANLSFIYKTQYKNFYKKTAWPMPCLAGKSTIVINHKGELSSCELRKPISDLKKEKYNVKKVLKSKKFLRELGSIKKYKCFCTHVCFLTDSMYASPNVVFVQIPILWIKNLFNLSI
ncbi:radical SAM protein [Patescibacteria group bacterium]